MDFSPQSCWCLVILLGNLAAPRSPPPPSPPSTASPVTLSTVHVRSQPFTTCQLMRHEGLEYGKYRLCAPTGEFV